MEIAKKVLKIAESAKKASQTLSVAPTKLKNDALEKMAHYLIKNTTQILEENRKDIEYAKKKEMSKSLVDRLRLSEDRIEGMAQGLRDVAKLPDPVGEIVRMWKRPNGLLIGKMRTPLGVIGVIYEARPNVTSDAAGLCLKSGNAVILRGGKEAINSNRIITEVLQKALDEVKLPSCAISFIDIVDREAIREMVVLDNLIDVIIPRGGQEMIQDIKRLATVPVISHGAGNCHIYVDEVCDLDMAESVVHNAKCQRPGVCNAAETLLVHRKVAPRFLPRLFQRLKSEGVEIRGCHRTLDMFPELLEADESDWHKEYLDLILAVKIVDSIDEAILHISRYGTGHTEAILTSSYENSQRFLMEVDAASVFVNASTRFTDGGQFGLGAEIGISTQKLHARGPMGLEELTTTKFVVFGSGQIRE
jgi:glutamate-5-semialdehyde dehydrogenase